MGTVGPGQVPLPVPQTRSSLRRANDRHGDPNLRVRCTHDPDVHAAVMTWMVQGAKRWYDAGRVMPPVPSSVETDTHTWRKDADLCFRFIDDHLTFDPKYHIMATDFQAALSAWLLDLGHQKWSDKTVTARFGDYEAFVQQHVIKKKIRGTSSFIPRLPQEMRFYPDRAAAQAHVDNVPVSYAAWCGSVGKARPL